MLHNRLRRVYSDPGLQSQSLNRKFERIFTHQVEMDYSAYVQAKRPAAHRWASTWGRTWNRK